MNLGYTSSFSSIMTKRINSLISTKIIKNKNKIYIYVYIFTSTTYIRYVYIYILIELWVYFI